MKQNKKKKKNGYLGMLLGSLTASFLGSALADKIISKGAGLLANMLAGKRIVGVDDGVIRVGLEVIRAGHKF